MGPAVLASRASSARVSSAAQAAKAAEAEGCVRLPIHRLASLALALSCCHDGRLQRVEPGLGGLLGGGAGVGRRACRRSRRASRSVSPRGLGDQVPFGRLDRIGRRAAALGEDAREPVLGDGAAAQRRLAEQRRGGLFVLGDAVAVEQRDGIFDLRRRYCRRAPPAPTAAPPRACPSARRGPPCRACRARIALPDCRPARRRAAVRRRA